MAIFAQKTLTHGTSKVDLVTVAKSIIFAKIGLANGIILKMLVAHPYPKFGQDPK